LSEAGRVWQRAWLGGAIGGYKTGEKDVRVEVVGWPCARIPYCRHALRGLLLGVTKLLSTQASAYEIPALQTDSSAAYRIVWR
jgi:hypothetical protein